MSCHVDLHSCSTQLVDKDKTINNVTSGWSNSDSSVARPNPRWLRMLRCCSSFRKPFNAYYGLLSMLDACNSVHQLKQTHAQLITTGLFCHPILANKLLKLVAFSSFGSLHYAHQVFQRIPNPDLFIYNTVIKAHALSPTSSYNSFLVFLSMIQSSTLLPNQYTFVFVFNACGNGLWILQGNQVRVHAIKLGFENNLFVTNALIGMYGKCGLVEEGRKVFDWAMVRDMYSWNTMMAVYTGSGKMDQAKDLFSKMPERDVVSWSTIIAGYVQVFSTVN